MFRKAIRIDKNSTFPIFRFDVTPTQTSVKVVGTGFFINSKGYFVSVAHVFDNPTPGTSFNYWGQVPDQISNPPIPIVEVAKDDQMDVFIGKIETNNPNYFYLSSKDTEIGKSICISGYPLAEIRMNAQGGPDLGGVRRYFQPSFILDKANAQSNTAGVTREHRGYLVRDVGLFGMSGGPVFDTKGIVVGMQGSVTPPRVSRGSGGRTISVENAIIIGSKLIHEILKRNKIRTNFLGKF